ncbi:MAG: hypothetical protein BZ135_07090 [Methanosphaera sp. rholeuAM6]|nr:MAG: hypothetical protein BZ135_07090 [Methanosphaera sp. rholeuAM6]
MNKTVSSILIIVLILFTGVFAGYLIDNNGNINENDLNILGIEPEEKTDFTVSSEGPVNLGELIEDIKNNTYFAGYNKDTLHWMESLLYRDVFITSDGYLIMNYLDASKINSEYVTDAYIEEYVKCVVVENHSLGGNHSKNVYLVKNVENLGNQTFNLQDKA